MQHSSSHNFTLITPVAWLPVLSNIVPLALRRKAATDKLVEKIEKTEHLANPD